MKRKKQHHYFCRCGEPIDLDEVWCLSCQNEFQYKYGNDVAHFAIRGFEDENVLLEDPKGNIHRVTLEEYQQLEEKDLVWYSFDGVADYRKK